MAKKPVDPLGAILAEYCAICRAIDRSADAQRSALQDWIASHADKPGMTAAELRRHRTDGRKHIDRRVAAAKLHAMAVAIGKADKLRS